MGRACFIEFVDTTILKYWLKSSSALISIKDTEGKYIGLSDTYAKFLGFENSDEIIEKYTTDIFSLKNAASYSKQDKLVINTARQLTFKNKYIHPERGLLYLEVVKTPILNEKKFVVAIETVVTDVTEKYLLLHKLQREQLKIKRFFNDIPVAVWIKDAKNRYINVNREFCEIFNVKKDEIIGQKSLNKERLVGIIGEDDFARMQSQDEFVLKENKRQAIDICATLNEENRCIRMIKIPILGNGKVIGLIGCCHYSVD